MHYYVHIEPYYLVHALDSFWIHRQAQPGARTISHSTPIFDFSIT